MKTVNVNFIYDYIISRLDHKENIQNSYSVIIIQKHSEMNDIFLLSKNNL